MNYAEVDDNIMLIRHLLIFCLPLKKQPLEDCQIDNALRLLHIFTVGWLNIFQFEYMIFLAEGNLIRAFMFSTFLSYIDTW